MASKQFAALRRSVKTFREPADRRAALICLLDAALFSATLAAVVVLDSALLKALAGALMGLSIARLFVIGHDACHQAFFSSRRANRWIGKLAFLPSLTPYSLWETGHNVSHHVYTNLKGHDFVWTPMSKAEYDEAPPWRRALERLYRSGLGFWAYYGIEIWWRKLMFPNVREVPVRRPAFLPDCLLVSAFGALWVAGLAIAAVQTGQSVALMLGTGFLLPFFVWTLLMGAVIYFHHTNPDVVWYDDTEAWEAARDGIAGTMLITFPRRAGRLINNIMEHPAHHLDVRIPLYNLEAAQAHLNDQQAGSPTQAFTLAFVLDCVRRCKLYDYEAQRWTDFSGTYTSEAPQPLPAAA